MSWYISTKNPVEKRHIDSAIDLLAISQEDGPMEDQLRIAKQAAKLIAATTPGPYLSVALNGHANGVGWQKREGWSNDYISVTVTQITETPDGQ